MKILENKGIIFKLIVSLCVFLALINFLGSIDVYAAEEASAIASGGKLLQPILDFAMTICDGILNLIQKAIMETPATVTLDIATTILGVVIAVLAAAIVVVAIIVATGGIGAIIAGIGGVAGSVLTAITSSAVVTFLVTGLTIVAGVATYNVVFSGYKAAFLPDYTVIPTFAISPEEIFSGNLLIFDVNFFNPKVIMVAPSQNAGDGNPTTDDEGETVIEEGSRMSLDQWNEVDSNGQYINRGNLVAAYYYYIDVNGNEVKTSAQSAAMALSQVISKWYYTIRNMAIVVLMVILVYVGIRMLLTSIASEKSKYKKMLGDWVIALCLVFVMHYIMIFAVNINENIVLLMRSITSHNSYIHMIELDGSGKSNKLKEALENAGLGDFIDNSTSPEKVVIPTNLLGQSRLLAQKMDGTAEYVGYAMAYICLSFYTVFFVFTYLRRVLMMAFLTVISPLVAVTYPIDKISDGKAQAFNKWLKEYIFNLLIQPVHLLLYVLLISMAFELASKNIIYTLVAIGFMIPAEKFVRSLFGFDKASTPGFLSGAAGAALTMAGLQHLSNLGKKGGMGPKGGLQAPSDKDNNDPKGLYNRSANSGNGFESLLGSAGFANDKSDNFETKIGGDNNQQPNPTSLNDDSQVPLTDSPNNGVMDENMQDDLLDREGSENATGKELPYTADDFNADLIDPNDYIDGDYTNLSYDDDQLEYTDSDDEVSMMTDGDTSIYMDSTRRLNTDNMEARRKGREMVNRQREAEEAERILQEMQPKPKVDSAQQRQQKLKDLKGKNNTIGARAKNRVKMALDSGKRYIKDPHTYTNAVAKAIDMGVQTATTGLGVAAGVASGITSGSPKDVLQDATVGGAAGKVLGGTLSNTISQPIRGSVEAHRKAKEASERERYGANYSAIKKIEADEKFKKDSDARKTYENEFSDELKDLKGKEREEKLDEIMEDAIKYREYGITDNEKIIKAMNLDKNNRTSQKSIASALMASKATDLKGIESYQKRLEGQVGKQQAEEIATGAMKINGLGFTKSQSARQQNNSNQRQTQQPRSNTNSGRGPRNNPPTPTNPNVTQT